MVSEAGFKLPSWNDLSEEQESIVTLPTTRNYVIEGAPGTGKTVMALYRAARISQRDDDDITILVYNRPLMLYMKTAVSGNPLFSHVEINTYHSWITAFYKKYLHKSVPKIDTYELNWDEILNDFRRIPKILNHIIIDEAQDFPIELITALTQISDNITCFIDPNQAIEANKTRSTDALKKLCVEHPRRLTRNYRNSKEITTLSRVYYHGDEKCFAYPNASNPSSGKPEMIRCRDYDDQTNKIIELIRNNREKSICVLVNNKSLNITYNTLSNAVGNLVSVEMFKSMSRTDEINFGRKGVKILSFGTMKGLEFDMVIITRFEKMRSTNDPVADINRAYVAITRACKKLSIIYFGTQCAAGWADVMNPILRNRELLNWE